MAATIGDIPRDLECDVCLELYDNPKILDCRHSFCERCLQRYYTIQFADKTDIHCPVCRANTVLPQTRIRGLQTNFQLIERVEELLLLEKLCPRNTQVMCEVCDEQHEALHRCLNCAQNICANCVKVHLRFLTSSNHRVVNLEDIHQGKVPVVSVPRCQKHPREVKQFYCETCLELICQNCIGSEHCPPEHRCVLSLEVAPKYRQSLRNIMSNMHTRFEKYLTGSSRDKEEFTDNVTNVKKALQRAADEMRAAITTQETKMIKDIDQLQWDRTRAHDEQEKKVKMMQDKSKSLETAINAQDEVFLSEYPSLKNKLEFQQFPQNVPKPPHLSFIPGKIGDTSLGRLTVTEGSYALMPGETDEPSLRVFDTEEQSERLDGLGFSSSEGDATVEASKIEQGSIVPPESTQRVLDTEEQSERLDGLGFSSSEGDATVEASKIEQGSIVPPESTQLPLCRVKMIADKFETHLMKLTDSDRLGKRLQLPYLAIGYFNENGGSLYLDKYDVHLTIPRGAIASGPQQVYIYVDPTAQENDGTEFQSQEVGLSKVIQCGPPGITFQESVLLSFPHQVVKPNANCHLLSVRMRKGVNSSEAWEKFDGDIAVINKEKVILLLEHFSWLQLVTWFFTRRLAVGAFGDVFHPCCAKYGFRVHVWKDSDDYEQKVLHTEEQSQKLDGPKYWGFSSRAGDVTVEISKIDSGWIARPASTQIISKTEITTLPTTSVTFDLSRSPKPSDHSESLYCEIHIRQLSDTPIQKPVLLLVSPKTSRSRTQDSTVAGASAQLSAPPVVTESDRPCTCSETIAGFCAKCQPNIAAAFSEQVHGEVDEANFGGLSTDTVQKVCEYLDADSPCNWRKLAERLAHDRYYFIKKAEKMDHPTKKLLKVYFERYRQNQWEGKKAVKKLVLEFEDLKLQHVADIVKEDLSNMP